MSRPLRPAQVVEARVVAAARHGLHLVHGNTEILVHITDVPWGNEIAAQDYAAVGDVLDVTILRLTEDGHSAVGWLPWPDPRPQDGSQRHRRTAMR